MKLCKAKRRKPNPNKDEVKKKIKETIVFGNKKDFLYVTNFMVIIYDVR